MAKRLSVWPTVCEGCHAHRVAALSPHGERGPGRVGPSLLADPARWPPRAPMRMGRLAKLISNAKTR